MKIRNVIQKSGSMKRYKLNVQIYLGEKKNQKVIILAKGWWDDYVDNYVTYTYQGDYFYCTCVTYTYQGDYFYCTCIVWGFYTD